MKLDILAAGAGQVVLLIVFLFLMTLSMQETVACRQMYKVIKIT